MTGHRIWRNTTVATLVYLLGSVVGLFTIPILLAQLGSNRFAVYTLAQVIAGYSSLLSLGIGAGFVRTAAARNSVSGPGSVAEVVETGSTIFVGLGVVLIALGFLLARPLTSLFGIPSQFRADSQLMFTAGFFVYALNAIAGVYTGSLVAVHRYDLAKWVELGQVLLGAAGCVTAAYLGWGLPGVAVSLMAASLLGLVAAMYLSRIQGLWRRVLRWRLSGGLVRELWSYGYRNQLLYIAALVNRSSAKLFLGVLRPLGSVSTYEVGDRAATSLAYTSNMLAGPLLPVVTSQLARDDLPAVRVTYRHAAAVFSLGASTILVFAVAFAEPIMQVWVGSDLRGSGRVLSALIVGYGLAVSCSAADVVARSEAVPRLAARVGIASCVATVAAVLGGALTDGVFGAAVGFSAVAALVGLAYAALVERRLLKMSGVTAARMILSTLIVATPFAIAARYLLGVVENVIGVGRLELGISLLISGGPLGVVALLAATMSPGMPRDIRQWVRQMVRRIGAARR